MTSSCFISELSVIKKDFLEINVNISSVTIYTFIFLMFSNLLALKEKTFVGFPTLKNTSLFIFALSERVWIFCLPVHSQMPQQLRLGQTRVRRWKLGLSLLCGWQDTRPWAVICYCPRMCISWKPN